MHSKQQLCLACGAPFRRQKVWPLALCLTQATVYLSTGLKGMNLRMHYALEDRTACQVCRILSHGFAKIGWQIEAHMERTHGHPATHLEHFSMTQHGMHSVKLLMHLKSCMIA